jgi:hypothetical protein
MRRAASCERRTQGRARATTVRAALIGAAVALTSVATASAQGATIRGKVESGDRPISRAPVTLFRTAARQNAPVAIAKARSNRRGRFALHYRKPKRAGAVLYVASGVPETDRRREVRLATLLDARRARRGPRVTLNERTTVAAGFAEAQFIDGWRIAGRKPGPQNATMMARNLALAGTGGLSPVLRKPPNGRRMPTLETFNSLANMLAGCARREARCSRLFKLTRARGERRADSTLQAFANVARNPAERRLRLFGLSKSGPRPYGPALSRSERPNNWQLFLRFVGDGKSMNGPGNIAFDAEGNAWVANNYQYSRNPLANVCGGRQVLEFRPDGSYEPGSPYRGGGLSGVGYGITLDPDGNIWLGNFGFATPGCAHQPPHNSISEFAPNGTPISPRRGYRRGEVSWPQGTVSDRRGNIWIANCGPNKWTGEHNTLTIYPDGDPRQAISVADDDLDKPFDIAFNRRDRAFASSTASDLVGMYRPDGTPTAKSPITGGGLNKPMGVASDSRGNVWVSNSGVVDLPCPGAMINLQSKGGSITLIRKNGDVLSPHKGFRGGGTKIPWGVAVDGDDTVWISNFAGRRVSRFCGMRTQNCPKGRRRTGAPISPRQGYGFTGLTRNTAVEIDPSGNLWIVNNWKNVPIQTNPGGYQIVIMVGAAAPLKTPLIGTPRSP